MSWRKKIGWRGPLSLPVSLMTRAVRASCGWGFCAASPVPWRNGASGLATDTTTAIPAANLPHLFVINALDGECIVRVSNGLRAPGCSPGGERRARAKQTLFGSRQQHVFEANDLDERVHRIEVGELHPAPAHAA